MGVGLHFLQDPVQSIQGVRPVQEVVHGEGILRRVGGRVDGWGDGSAAGGGGWEDEIQVGVDIRGGERLGMRGRPQTIRG